MANKDKSGIQYESIVEKSLIHLGYVDDIDSDRNYRNPSPRDPIIIPGTYIQPDFLVFEEGKPKAIIYVTHWSDKAVSMRKFWRTWEEVCQQRVALGKDFLAINCVFEALPSTYQPELYIDSHHLPLDLARDKNVPIAFNGWYPGITWAMVESFDSSIIFPLGYSTSLQESRDEPDSHDLWMTKLLNKSLNRHTKQYLVRHWNSVSIHSVDFNENTPSLIDTKSRYRIGLLHLYVFYRFFRDLNIKNSISVQDFSDAILQSIDPSKQWIDIDKLIGSHFVFRELGHADLELTFKLLSDVYVRKGKDSKKICEIKELTHPILERKLFKIFLNSDLKICLSDLKQHANDSSFLQAIENAFNKFDSTWCMDEFFDDLRNPELIREKTQFVVSNFSQDLADAAALNRGLQKHAKSLSEEREKVCNHRQGWVLEMLLYLAGLNSDEDILTKFKEFFEISGHTLRPHAPFGDDAAVIRYLLQGRDIDSHWSEKQKLSTDRTLSQEEFKELAWYSISKSVSNRFIEKGGKERSAEEIMKKYQQSKAMRIVGAELDGLSIMVEHYLSDICFLYSQSETVKKTYKKILKKRTCLSWQTEVIKTIWKGRPLTTRFEGVSHDGKWLIKVKSSQDGHEADKTKELAGRCRAMRLAWSHGEDPHDRSQWTFSERSLPKLALVLDGDWDATKKRNLYEAGWDWIGDVSQLDQLRQLIQEG